MVLRWCRELAPAVKAAWGLQAAALPVQVQPGFTLNASIDGSREAPRITVTENLLGTLATFNRNVFAIGWQMLFCEDAMLQACDPLMNDLLGRVIAMSPPHAVAPPLEEGLTRPGFEAYRKNYQYNACERLEQQGTQLLMQLAGPGGDVAAAVRPLQRLAEQLAAPATQLQLLECQVKFLLLHELAHLQLGHLGGATTAQSELDADRLAADVYLEASRALREAGELVIDTPALVLLFAAVGLVEDLMGLTDRAVAYAIPEYARPAYRPLMQAHPQTRHRARATLGSLPARDCAHFVAYVTEVALSEMKDQFRQGVVDGRRFKWYCRVRAQEHQAQWATLAQPRGESRQAFAGRVHNESGWDTQDLQWGPLVNEIFAAEWFEPVSLVTPQAH
jgi:hypothetical protein